MTFGEFHKQHRLALRSPLRSYCRQHKFEPVDISKLERGRIGAPRTKEMLDRYMMALGLDEAERRDFVALAAISAERAPEPLTDEQLASHLPVLANFGDASEDDLRKFAEWLREKL